MPKQGNGVKNVELFSVPAHGCLNSSLTLIAHLVILALILGREIHIGPVVSCTDGRTRAIRPRYQDLAGQAETSGWPFIPAS